MHDPANQAPPPSSPRDTAETAAGSSGLGGPLSPDSSARAATDTPAPATPDTSTPEEEESMETTSMEFLGPEHLQALRLREDPFEPAESPENIFMYGPLNHIEAALMRGIHRRHVLAVVGPPGAGKSTILRRLYGKSSREKRVRMLSSALINRKEIDHSALTVAILRDLIGEPPRGMSKEQRADLLRNTLEDHARAEIYPALVIDEAHLLKTTALLALKHLWDSHTMFRQLAIIMVGQLPLQGKLRSDPALRELTGRTRILDIPELGKHTAAYLRWRFARVGGDADQVFSEDAYEALAMRGKYPLWINNLAVKAIHYAHAMGEERVTARCVGRA